MAGAACPDGADVVARAARIGRSCGALRSARVSSIVSGALDAWRFRDRSVSAFDRFWQSLVADAATNAPPADRCRRGPIGDRAERGDECRGHAPRRGAVEREAGSRERRRRRSSRRSRASLRATFVSGPTGTLVSFAASCAAASPGIYRLVVASGGARASTPIVVASDAAHPALDARDLLAAFANAHGGRALPASQIKSLPAALNDAIRPRRVSRRGIRCDRRGGSFRSRSR